MSSPSADTRVTAYVFGELSQPERHQFEKELGESEALREEVAAVRDAVAAVRAELDGDTEGVGQARRSRIEAAIASSVPGSAAPEYSTTPESADDVASPSTAVAASNSVPSAAPSRKLLSILALAASVLLVVALIYTNRPAEFELSMNDEIRRDRPQPTRGLTDQSRGKVEESASVASDGLAMKAYPRERPQVAAESFEEAELLKELEEPERLYRGRDADASSTLARGLGRSVAGNESTPAAKSAAAPFSDTPIAAAEPSREVPATGESRSIKMDASGSRRMKESGRDDTLGESLGIAAKEQSLRQIQPSPGGDDASVRLRVAQPPTPTKPSLRQQSAQQSASASRSLERVVQSQQAPMPTQQTPLPETRPKRRAVLPRLNVAAEPSLDGIVPPSTPVAPDDADKKGLSKSESGLATSLGGAAPVDGFGISPDGRAVVGGRAVRGEEVDNGTVTELGMLGGIELERGAAAEGTSGDRFEPIEDNPFVDVDAEPLSTFSIDVDTASYAKVRKYLLQQNVLPPPASVRIEELVNYFPYDYAAPANRHPFSAAIEIAECPWNPEHRLARIGIKGRVIEQQRPPSNLVFLLDVSGSMKPADKLPLVVEGMKLLTEQLTENDSVAIVVYAGNAGLVLDATNGDQKQTIMSALERLRAGGSTDGGSGIQLAYDIARDHFVVGGTNRVILCTDGDFNVGLTGPEELKQLAEDKAKSNVYLSVLGFGIGNHNDAMMEEISNRGNGNYAFIDSKSEAQKVLVEQMGGTLVTIAKDVKIQVAFNADEVQAYRLIGYENRMLNAEDFDNDAIDAGEIGAGHTVTALYELIPPGDGSDDAVATESDSRSQVEEGDVRNESLTLKLNYKLPDTGVAVKGEIEIPAIDQGKEFGESDDDFQFAAAVASFGMLLRNSPHRGDSTFAAVDEIASGSVGDDSGGYRTEFLELVRRAKQLSGE